LAKILEEVQEFCGDFSRSDDITLMIIRVGER
jgi:serine phosphatase RsbU (regulator of sigma subunit)